MAVLIASSLRKELSGSVLFDDVSFKVERPDRLALAGPNGAGKTTLLRALARETSLDGGELAWEKGARVALHDQRPPAASKRPLREYVLAGTADLAAVEDELRTLEQAMASGDHGAATLRRYSEAQHRLEHAGGYDWRDRAASVVRGLGFTEDDLDRPLSTFSGGELTRASLARALASQPDLLLLDEPTNHLDIESLEWLEGMLRTLDAAVILVAHDRWFLEAVTTAVLELESGKSVFFPGAWHVWRLEQAARAQHLAKTADAAGRGDRAPRALRRAVPLQGVEGAAGAVEAEADRADQGRPRRDARSAEARARLRVPEAAALGPRRRSSSRASSCRRATSSCSPARSFAIERGEHVALVGPNGSGKTTLLETILGNREPAAGRVRLGHGVDARRTSRSTRRSSTSAARCSRRR